jgi:hypothetical protein
MVDKDFMSIIEAMWYAVVSCPSFKEVPWVRMFFMEPMLGYSWAACQADSCTVQSTRVKV